MSSRRKLERSGAQIEVTGAHLGSNQRDGDPLVIVCTCTYATTGQVAITVVQPGQAIKCWVCEAELCDGCKAKLAQKSKAN